jgi:hypothetical protein
MNNRDTMSYTDVPLVCGKYSTECTSSLVADSGGAVEMVEMGETDEQSRHDVIH